MLLQCLISCFSITVFLIVSTFFVLTLYPLPTIHDISKEWPIQTIDQYNKIEQQGLNQTIVQFPPKLAKFKLVELSSGITLNVLEGGEGKENEHKKVLLFIHGFPESALLCWGRYLDYFINKGYHVIAPDLRGYNKSSKPPYPLKELEQDYYNNIISYLKKLWEIPKYYYDKEFAADLYLLIKEHLKKDKVTVISHDWGSALSYYLFNFYPEVIEKVVVDLSDHQFSLNALLQDPYYFFRQFIKSYYVFAFNILGLSDEVVSRRDFTVLFNFMGIDKIGKEGKISAEEAINYLLPNFQSSIPYGISYYRGVRFNEKTLSAPLKINVPCLMIHYELDDFIDIGSFKFTMEYSLTQKAKEKSKIVEIKNTPHWMQYYAKKEVIPLIESFIEQE